MCGRYHTLWERWVEIGPIDTNGERTPDITSQLLWKDEAQGTTNRIIVNIDPM